LIGLASLNRKAGIVQRTKNLVSNKRALGEAEAEMRAFALDGINFALVIDDQDGVLWLRPN
jgi:hypothetical protein